MFPTKTINRKSKPDKEIRHKKSMTTSKNGKSEEEHRNMVRRNELSNTSKQKNTTQRKKIRSSLRTREDLKDIKTG